MTNKTQTVQDIVRIVANEFADMMRDDGFETFKEMRECYWWDTQDIADEVKAIMGGLETGWYIDEEDGKDVINQELGIVMPYKKFIAAVYKDIKVVMNDKTDDEQDDEEE